MNREKILTDNVLLRVTNSPYIFSSEFRVAEIIRLVVSLVNCLVANVEKVFIEVPFCHHVDREKFPGMSICTEPVLTRWGTSLKPSDFISIIHNGIIEVISDFTYHSSVAIEEYVNLVNDR